MAIKTLFSSRATKGNKNSVYIDFDSRSSIVKSVFDCRLSGVRLKMRHTVYKLKPSSNRSLFKLIISVLKLT